MKTLPEIDHSRNLVAIMAAIIYANGHYATDMDSAVRLARNVLHKVDASFGLESAVK